MKKHVLQSDYWAQFKNDYGTPAVSAGGVVYTKHPIPFTPHCYAYCPRVNPFDIDFAALETSLKENNCIAIHFDVPNVIAGSPDAPKATELLAAKCVKSTRDEFAKGNFYLDLTQSEETLLANMQYKHRYNINYAIRKGVTCRVTTAQADFDKFYGLYKETGVRQKYFFRSKTYLQKMWDVFNAAGLIKLVFADFEGQALAAWLVINYENTLYYIYGGSTEQHKNLQASCLVGWEAIKLGKQLGCGMFDMWGAAADVNNTKDPYYGFTNFKAKFGGKHVTYIDSYDFVINQPVYKIFTAANALRWKLLNVLK